MKIIIKIYKKHITLIYYHYKDTTIIYLIQTVILVTSSLIFKFYDLKIKHYIYIELVQHKINFFNFFFVLA